MNTKQLKAALVLAEEKERLEQRVAELDSEINAALNGRTEAAGADAPAWVKGPLDAKVFTFLKLRGEASAKDIANHCQSTVGNISNWLNRRRQYLANPSRGQWSIK